MISVTATATYPDVVASSFDFVTAEDVLPKVLHRFGPVPAVVETVVLDGPEWDRPGCRREVHLDDGSMLHEEIDELIHPTTFSYNVTPQTGMLRHVIRAARGEWQFAPSGEQTDAVWTYRFVPRTPLLAPIVWVFARVFRGYMRAAHIRISDQIAAA